ncbi:MAG: PIN domain-containing protein [Bosea sp. (in: a-proteobacteria)]
MSGILIDTCIIIDVLRGHATALAWLKRQPEELSVCATSISEVRAGERGISEKMRFDRLLEQFVLVTIDADVTERAGVLLRQFAKSHGVGLGDAQIAAAAMAKNMPLATHNLRHFPMFPHLTAPY